MQNTAEVQEYLAAIISSSDDAIISKNLNGVITSWNPAAERIFGYKAEEVIGKHITTIIPQDRLEEEDTIIATLKRGERVEHFETWRRHKEGRLVPVSVTISPIRDASGTIIGASKIVRDINDRIQVQEALRDLHRRKDEFMANLSHELRTPMNAVIGLANLLKRSTTLSERDRKFVDTLKISADNLLELLNDMLDFAKIEADSVQLEHVLFNLEEQVQAVASVMRVKSDEKHLNLLVDYAPGLQRNFLGDPLRIQRILTNLVSNAIKFTEMGRVAIHINGQERQDGETVDVILKISDTGIGIAEDRLKVIFERFSQADASITRRYGGTGLGLAIIHGLTEKMGGSIEVESTLGQGTTFTVHLPLIKARVPTEV